MMTHPSTSAVKEPVSIALLAPLLQYVRPPSDCDTEESEAPEATAPWVEAYNTDAALNDETHPICESELESFSPRLFEAAAKVETACVAESQVISASVPVIVIMLRSCQFNEAAVFDVEAEAVHTGTIDARIITRIIRDLYPVCFFMATLSYVLS